MDDIGQILKLLAGKSRVEVLPGNFLGFDALRPLVDFGGGRVPADSVTVYRPELNEPIWVVVVDGRPYMLGPTIPKPGQGTVATVGTDYLTVQTDVGMVRATYPNGGTFTSGQQVKLYWSDGPHVLSVMSTTPEPPPAAAPAVTTGAEHVQTFTAIDAGSWHLNYGRWWTAQVWAADNNVGAWFYGSKIADTIPDGAAIVSVEIYISATQISGSAPVFGTHGWAGKPGGPPDIFLQTSVGVGNGWVSLPVSFADALKAQVGGIGVNHGGYSKFRSLGEDGQSGALRIRYRT